MGKIKEIEQIFPPPPVHMVGDGFRVHTFFPGHRISGQRMSPFYLLDYNSKYHFPSSLKPRGVGVHPHRGFKTVTVAYKGTIAHHDSFNTGLLVIEGKPAVNSQETKDNDFILFRKNSKLIQRPAKCVLKKK